ncbi:Endosulphine [Corchorus capsularis]|uniref:Endosulphine n=1 Tax=Corchorus capsularis TaxID=210143 RepID=A0A1R3G650_COCAP|nr:Endosulphine [Corchorus capsularis]
MDGTQTLLVFSTPPAGKWSPTKQLAAEGKIKMADCKQGEEFYGSQEHEGTTAQKYGGLVPKKKPLISKDHERAFFDSADWALCKQGAAGVNQKSTVAIETLRPKLQGQ